MIIKIVYNDTMKIILTLFIAILSLYAQQINVAVAANVSYAMPALIKAFEKQHPDITVETTLGGSGKLTAQIKNGAPYDIFMSANMKYPQALYKEDLAITKPRIYAEGALAILSTKERDFSQGMNIVKSVNIIAIANPKTAPYGAATVEALKNAKLYNEIKNKFVYGQSIAQTVAFTMTAADIGFIAKSALYSSKMKRFQKERNYIEVPSKLYTPIKQGIVLLKRAKGNQAADAFYTFIATPEARKIFHNYGYTLP